MAAWFALTASHRLEAASMAFLTALFTALTVASLVGQGGPELARDDGSVARSVALGLVFVAGRPVRGLGTAPAYRSDREWPRAASLAEPMRRRSLTNATKEES